MEILQTREEGPTSLDVPTMARWKQCGKRDEDLCSLREIIRTTGHHSWLLDHSDWLISSWATARMQLELTEDCRMQYKTLEKFWTDRRENLKVLTQLHFAAAYPTSSGCGTRRATRWSFRLGVQARLHRLRRSRVGNTETPQNWQRRTPRPTLGQQLHAELMDVDPLASLSPADRLARSSGPGREGKKNYYSG